MRTTLAASCLVIGAMLAPAAAYAADRRYRPRQSEAVRQGLGHYDQDQGEASRPSIPAA